MVTASVPASRPAQAAPPSPDRPLTPRQRQVLGRLELLTRAVGYPPTMTELGRGLGLSTSRVLGHLRALARKGLVTWEPKRSRTLSLTAAGRAALEPITAAAGGRV
jgi:DNA-binding MarR family transcriptional regulator